MLRVALKILLALSLLMQGGVVVFAVGASHGHAPCHGMQQHAQAPHGAPAKLPCCPPDCSMPGGMAACAACGAALMATPEFVVVRLQPVATTSHESDLSIAADHRLPPTRPPIA